MTLLIGISNGIERYVSYSFHKNVKKGNYSKILEFCQKRGFHFTLISDGKFNRARYEIYVDINNT